MFDSKTIVAALIAFGLGSIASVNFPVVAALRQAPSTIPIKATPGARGVTYERVAKDSSVTMIVLKTTNTVVAYELGRGYIHRGGKFYECRPATCPLPPPCPPTQDCPWQAVKASHAK